MAAGKWQDQTQVTAAAGSCLLFWEEESEKSGSETMGSVENAIANRVYACTEI